MGTSESKSENRSTRSTYSSKNARSQSSSSSYTPSAPSYSAVETASGSRTQYSWDDWRLSDQDRISTSHAYTENRISDHRTMLYPDVTRLVRKEESKLTQHSTTRVQPVQIKPSVPVPATEREAPSWARQDVTSRAQPAPTRPSVPATTTNSVFSSSARQDVTSRAQTVPTRPSVSATTSTSVFSSSARQDVTSRAQPVPTKPSVPATTTNSVFSSSARQSYGSSSSKSGVNSNLYPQIPASLREEAELTQTTGADRKTRNKDINRKKDDCKFYFFDTCSKGDRCPFRHEPEALKYSSPATCRHWEKNDCHKEHCPFRHMQLKNNTTPCYWEPRMPNGCNKPKCPFVHSKPRNVGATEVKNLLRENKPNATGAIPKRRELGSYSNVSQFGEDENASSVTNMESYIRNRIQKLRLAERQQADDDSDEVASVVSHETDSQRPRRNVHMKNEDCIFFYYSTCTRQRCIFRHDPESLGNTEVCYDWREGKCNRRHCKFRHMELQNNSQPCWWEENENGCLIEGCPFKHKFKNSGDHRVIISNNNSSTTRKEGGQSRGGHRGRRGRRGGGRMQKSTKPSRDDSIKTVGNERDDSMQSERNEQDSTALDEFVDDESKEWWEDSYLETLMPALRFLANRPVDSTQAYNIPTENEQRTSTADDHPSDSIAKPGDKHRRRPRHRNRSGGRERKNTPLNSNGDGDIPEETGREAASVSKDSENAAAKLLELEKKLQETEKKLEEQNRAAEEAKLEQERLANAKLEDMKKDLRKKLEEEFTCVICQELFITAITLQCSHTFCQYCITEWRRYERSCPTCRNVIISETKALSIDNYIKESVSSLPREAQLQRAEAIMLRQ